MARKIFVDMNTLITKDGKMRPVSFYFEDGLLYEIDKVLDVRQAASLKVGGAGIRYTCRIQNATRYIFFEEDRWFLESEK